MISSFNWLDILLGVIFILFLIRGLWVGLFRQVLALVFYFFAFYLAVNFYIPASRLLQPLVGRDVLARFLAFLLIFCLVVAGGAAFSWTLRKLIEKAKLSGVDRFLGALFGMLRGFVVAMIIIMAFVAFPIADNLLQGSFFARHLVVVVDWSLKAMPDSLARKIHYQRKSDHDKQKDDGTDRTI